MTNEQLYKFEVMDCSSTVLDMLQRLLGEHPGLTKRTAKKLDKASDALYKLYNEAATEYWKGVK